jgi:hypothetical protein
MKKTILILMLFATILKSQTGLDWNNKTLIGYTKNVNGRNLVVPITEDSPLPVKIIGDIGIGNNNETQTIDGWTLVKPFKRSATNYAITLMDEQVDKIPPYKKAIPLQFQYLDGSVQYGITFIPQFLNYSADGYIQNVSIDFIGLELSTAFVYRLFVGDTSKLKTHIINLEGNLKSFAQTFTGYTFAMSDTLIKSKTGQKFVWSGPDAKLVAVTCYSPDTTIGAFWYILNKVRITAGTFYSSSDYSLYCYTNKNWKGYYGTKFLNSRSNVLDIKSGDWLDVGVIYYNNNNSIVENYFNKLQHLTFTFYFIEE